METPFTIIRERIDPTARRLWSAESDNGNIVDCYAAGEHTCIAVAYPDGNGWELYVPASRANSVGATVTAARRALGIDE